MTSGDEMVAGFAILIGPVGLVIIVAWLSSRRRRTKDEQHVHHHEVRTSR